MKQTLNIQHPEKKGAHLPISVKSALSKDTPKLLNAGAILKMFGEDQTKTLFEQKVEIFACKSHATYVVDHVLISTIDLSEDLTDLAKMNLIKSAVEYMNPVVVNTDKKPKAVKPKILGVDMAHDAIEAELSGVTNAVSLPEAENFYDPVRSTSAGARYVYIAKEKKGDAKLAVRFKGASISVRMEPFNPKLKLMAEVLGLNDNGSYASGHFQATDTNLVRYMNLLNGSLAGKWDVAKFNEQKIRDLGQ
jgi:hypothetical protein